MESGKTDQMEDPELRERVGRLEALLWRIADQLQNAAGVDLSIRGEILDMIDTTVPGRPTIP
jgi:hypothetical protein